MTYDIKRSTENDRLKQIEKVKRIAVKYMKVAETQVFIVLLKIIEGLKLVDNYLDTLDQGVVS